MRTITNTSNGSKIPVTMNLNVKPLFRSGKPVTNGYGEQIMDDQWIYVRDSNGCYSINVNRAKYCEKMYLSEVTIQSSIGEKKLMDEDLKKFCDQVSDKLVFQKYGRWYRVYLKKKTSRTFTISKVVPYVAIYNPNARVMGCYAYEICIDWKSKFYVN
jgi:hypothetical protein